jgi:hypothetical protein
VLAFLPQGTESKVELMAMDIPAMNPGTAPGIDKEMEHRFAKGPCDAWSLGGWDGNIDL